MVRSLGCVWSFATRTNLDSDHDSFPRQRRCGHPGEKASRGVALRSAYGLPTRNAPSSSPTPRRGTPTKLATARLRTQAKSGVALGGIFISYRREDSAHSAGRLYERLAHEFPRGQLLMDVDAIEPGLDFAKVLDEQVSGCDVLLAIIGPNWVGAKTQNGIRRLDDPDDYVRIEIATGLKRDIRVIPILVDGAPMPRAEELPEPLKPLARRNAVQVSHVRFGADTQGLVQVLLRITTPPKQAGVPGRKRIFLAVAGPDRPHVEEVALALRDEGHQVFLDEHELPPGESYHRRIREAIARADLAVFFISPWSLQPDRYTLTELKLLEEKWPHPRGRVLPTLIAPVDLNEVPPYLRAVSICKPKGNIAAEVAYDVSRMAAAL